MTINNCAVFRAHLFFSFDPSEIFFTQIVDKPKKCGIILFMISASVVSGRRVMKITFSPFPGCDDYSLQVSGDEVKIYHKPPRGQFFAHIMTVDRREIEVFLDDPVELISDDSLKAFVEHKKSFITPRRSISC